MSMLSSWTTCQRRLSIKLLQSSSIQQCHGRYLSAGYIACTEYNYIIQVTSVASVGEDEHMYMTLHHIAAWQLHWALSKIDVVLNVSK